MISEYDASRIYEPRRRSWQFASRIRRGRFGWRSARAASAAIRAAVDEIQCIARYEPIVAAEGATRLIERLPGTLEHIDRSCGLLELTVERAVVTLAATVGDAALGPDARNAVLERLWHATEDDRAACLEPLEEHWGRYCGSAEIASAWADEHLNLLRESELRTYVQGTTATLSALFTAERYEEIVTRLGRIGNAGWSYRRWGFKALVALGRPAAALHYAEASRSFSDPDLEGACEALFLSRGMQEEAYPRYAMAAIPFHPTNLGTFRAMCKKYARISPDRILADLATTTSPGREGRWFTTAVAAGLFDTALALARTSSPDPRLLVRAARERAATHPAFADAALKLALEGMALGNGRPLTPAEILTAERVIALTAVVPAGAKSQSKGRSLKRASSVKTRRAPRGTSLGSGF
jgi:hypothetical protein